MGNRNNLSHYKLGIVADGHIANIIKEMSILYFVVIDLNASWHATVF